MLLAGEDRAVRARAQSLPCETLCGLQGRSGRAFCSAANTTGARTWEMRVNFIEGRDRPSFGCALCLPGAGETRRGPRSVPGWHGFCRKFRDVPVMSESSELLRRHEAASTLTNSAARTAKRQQAMRKEPHNCGAA